MGKSLVQIPAQIIDFRPRMDKSYRISFETRQLSGEELSILADNFQGEGWLVFSPNEVSYADVPAENVESDAKSQSSRLRSVIYVLWCQQGKKGDFEIFYRQYLETLITFVKSKLADE